MGIDECILCCPPISQQSSQLIIGFILIKGYGALSMGTYIILNIQGKLSFSVLTFRGITSIGNLGSETIKEFKHAFVKSKLEVDSRLIEATRFISQPRPLVL